MLLIPHFIAPSPIHGLGCFSSINVEKGQKVWVFHPIIDRVIRQSDLDDLPLHVVQLVQTHAEFIPEAASFRLASDGDYFMNHADDPNLEDLGDWMVARKNISAGEEITCDYRIVKVWSFPVMAQSGPSDFQASSERVHQK